MKHSRFWIMSHAVSLLFLALIGIMWHNQANRYEPHPDQLVDQASVDTYLAEWSRTREDSGGNVSLIPTGIYLQSIDFVKAHDVSVSGYIWQVYPVRTKGNVRQGFILPEATGLTMKEVYRKTGMDGGEAVGWYFEGTLRQHFNYRNYPLDNKTIRIRIWEAYFDKDVVLVPDLSSYMSTGAEDIFGIKEDLVLPGWSIKESYFDYRAFSYDTNFRTTEYIGKNNFPELHFNVVIKRHLIDALLISAIPVVIINIILFAVVMVTSVKIAGSALFNFRAVAVYAMMPFISLNLILLNTKLRDTIHHPGFVYIESFHLLTFIALISVMVNSYYYARKAKDETVGFFNWEDNLLPKLLFWPILTGLGAAITFSWF